MNRKSGSESAWKALAVKHRVKDPGLQRALALLEKTDDGEPEARLKAIAAVNTHATALRRNKEATAEPPVARHLAELLDALDGLRRMAETSLKQADGAKKGEDEEDADEEEEGDYAERLLTGFKKLRNMQGRPMAFLVCEARPLPNVMVARRISSRLRKELSELTGGSRKFRLGTCHFADEHYVLNMEQTIPGLARKVQKSVKNHTGKKLHFSHGGETAGEDEHESEEESEEAEGEEEETDTESEEQSTADEGEPEPAPAPQAQAAPAPGATGAILTPEDRRHAFKAARAEWVAVKTRAEEDLEKVKNGAHEMYMDDAEQFPKIVQGCKDIDAIMDNLDNELRDTLDQYAAIPLTDYRRMERVGGAAVEVLDRYLKYVENNALMKAIDLKEFADVTIYAPVRKALRDLRGPLAAPYPNT